MTTLLRWEIVLFDFVFDSFLGVLGELADPASLQTALFFNLGGWLGLPPSTPPAYNTTQSLQAEIPAAGGRYLGQGRT